MDHLKDAVSALEKIRQSLLMIDEEFEFDEMFGELEFILPQSDRYFEEKRSRAIAIVEKLDKSLAESGWQPADPLSVPPMGQRWVYGIVPQRARMRPIVRGFLEPVRHAPLVSELPDRVVLYLRAVLPDGDGLEFENHGGVGWHYHYIDYKYRRSNVILSFDTRWTTPVRTSASVLRPLFVEPHGKAKARFKARPHLWSAPKRESIYAVCARDLRLGIENFRCAKNGAETVWPLGAILTPHPSARDKHKF
jgi:hypothetical protein